VSRIKDYCITLLGFILFVSGLIALNFQDWNSFGIASLGLFACLVLLLVWGFVEWCFRRAAEIREGKGE